MVLIWRCGNWASGSPKQLRRDYRPNPALDARQLWVFHISICQEHVGRSIATTMRSNAAWGPFQYNSLHRDAHSSIQLHEQTATTWTVHRHPQSTSIPRPRTGMTQQTTATSISRMSAHEAIKTCFGRTDATSASFVQNDRSSQQQLTADGVSPRSRNEREKSSGANVFLRNVSQNELASVSA